MSRLSDELSDAGGKIGMNSLHRWFRFVGRRMTNDICTKWQEPI